METILKEIEAHLKAIGHHVEGHNVHATHLEVYTFVTYLTFDRATKQATQIIARVHNAQSEWKLFVEF